MQKITALLLLVSTLFAEQNSANFTRELLLLHNPLLNDGSYQYSKQQTIKNYSIGREFLFKKSIETSLYISYSQEKLGNTKSHFYGVMTSLGYRDTIDRNSSYSFGLSNLFLKNHKNSNLTTLYAKAKYQREGNLHHYVEAELHYNLFRLPSPHKSKNGLELRINSGFTSDILKEYSNLPLTVSPYTQFVYYSKELKGSLEFSQLYTIGLEFSYNIGEYFQENSLFRSTKIKFNMQKTLSNRKFSGYNFALRLSIYDF